MDGGRKNRLREGGSLCFNFFLSTSQAVNHVFCRTKKKTLELAQTFLIGPHDK